MSRLRLWASTVACRIQWLFAIPPTKRQREERDELLRTFDAALQPVVHDYRQETRH